MLSAMPYHPLLVHIPVVLVPLTTLGVLIVIFRARWTRTIGPVLVALSAIGAGGAVLAAHSGEELEDQFRAAGQTITPLLRDHAELGGTAKMLAIVFFLTTAMWVGFVWWHHRREARGASPAARPAAIALAVLALLGGAAATTAVIATGHNGARSVWDEPAP